VVCFFPILPDYPKDGQKTLTDRFFAVILERAEPWEIFRLEKAGDVSAYAFGQEHNRDFPQ
jgi:hypothetical protein